MGDLLSRRFAALWVTAALLVVGLPGAALAVEAETPSESPSSGWVEQDTGTADPGGGSSEAQSGSSLGSGAAAAPAPEPEPEPAPVQPSPPPEPETTAPAPSAERAGVPEAVEEAPTATEQVVQPPVAEKPERRPLAGGAATVAAAAPAVTSEGRPTPQVVASPGSAGDATGDSSLSSSAVVLIVVLALWFAGLVGWFSVRRLRRRYRWRREAAEWKEAVAEWNATMVGPRPERPPRLTVRRVSEDGTSARTRPSNGAPPATVQGSRGSPQE